MSEPLRDVEVVIDSVDARALRLLETDPPEYFRRTHKRLPFGFSSSSATEKTK